MNMNMKISKPVMPYPGGKWKLAGKICSMMPAHHCYVEPFGGAASVLMQKTPSKVEIYNDLSEDIVNLFRVLREPVQSKELRRRLSLTPYSRVEWAAAYERCECPIEQARRTVIWAVMSYGSSTRQQLQSYNTFRISSKGDHQIARNFQGYVENLEHVAERLRYVIIEATDALDLMQKNQSTRTLFYVDPPYLASARARQRPLYSEELLDEAGHEKLLRVLTSIEGYVFLSGYPSPLYQDLLKGWQTYQFSAISGAGKTGLCHRTEVLWLNPPAADAQRQLRLW